MLTPDPIASLTVLFHTGCEPNEGQMAIAVRQPHKSWYQHFWYAERSPRERLTDKTLVFAIVALSLMVGAIQLVRHYARPHAGGPFPMTEAAGPIIQQVLQVSRRNRLHLPLT
jgi:hypothetical protein